MGRESAGGVYITIDGDYGPVIAKYAQLESQSKAAGQRITNTLGAGFKNGVSPILTELGKIQEAVTRVGTVAEPALQRTSTGLKSLASGAVEAEQKVQSFVGVIPGLGRAAEHFINLLPGVGSAIMAAFPVLGAIALIQNLKGMGGAALDAANNFLFLASAEKEAQRVGEETGKSLESSAEHLRDLTVEILRDQGKLVLAAQQAQYNQTQNFIHPPTPEKEKISGLADEDIAKINSAFAKVLPADVGERIRKVKQDLADVSNLLTQTQSNSLGPIDVFSTHIASQAKIAKELLGSALDFLKAKQDESEGDQIAGNARVAKARDQEQAEAARKAKEAAAEIKRQAAEEKRVKDDAFRQEREFMGLVRQGRKITADENKKLIKEESRDMMDIVQDYAREFEHEQDLERAAIVATTTARNRAAQEGIRAAGIRTGSADEISALRIEQAYALQIAHTRGEELQYAKDIAAADEKSLSDRISNLQALKAYQQVNALYDEANRTDLEIERAKSDQKKQQIQAAIALARVQREGSLAGQIQSAVGTGPKGFIDARNITIAHAMGTAVDGIAGALGRAAQGGQRLGAIFRDLARSVLGSVVQGIAKIGLQMAITAVTGKALGSAIAVAQVTSAAAVGAANAAAATALIPIIGPALAPAAAAATFAEIIAYAPLAAYAKGGFIPEDQIAQVHKGEFVLTADQVAGRTALPALPSTGALSSSASLTASAISNSSTQSQSNVFHIHGVHNVEQFARKLPNVLKARAPVFSPATR